MALISAMWGVATLVGPAVGGIFAELHAWRYAFGLLLPVTLLFAVLVWKSLPARQHKPAPAEPLPRLQLVLLASAVLAISAGSLSPHGWVNFSGIAAAIVLVLWLRKENSVALYACCRATPCHSHLRCARCLPPCHC